MGKLVIGLAIVITILIAGAVTAGPLFTGAGGQGETPSGASGSRAVAAAGSRWLVVRLPPSWKQFYTDELFEELRKTMQEMVDRYKLPADEFMALINWESSGNPNAANRSGALGLGQFMPDTAAAYNEFGPGDAEERARNRTNPIMALRAAARKLGTDRNNNFGEDWGTLQPAYLGPRPWPADGKNRRGRAISAYNSGETEAHYREKVLGVAEDYLAKGYVVRVSEESAAEQLPANTGELSPSNIKSVSAPFLDLPYGRKAKLRYESVQCLDCQTLIERTFAEILTPHFGSLSAAVDYLLKGADPQNHLPKAGRIQTPIPGWLYEPYGWPAREITASVAAQSGISPRQVHWVDFSGGLGDVDLPIIAWSDVPKIKAEAIDGTIVAFVSSTLSNGVRHVGFLFNDDGEVLLRHASSPSRGILDESLAKRVPQVDRYSGIIILQPDISKLKR